MYYYIPLISGGGMFLLALYMIIKPEKLTKDKNSETIKKTRRNGIIMLVGSIILCFIGISNIAM